MTSNPATQNPQRWLDLGAKSQAELDSLNEHVNQVRSMRDTDVVLAADHGATRREIGAALGISGRSVKKILDKHRPRRSTPTTERTANP